MVSPGVCLRHVGIVVSDLSRALQVYVDYLGLTTKKEYSDLHGEYQSRLVGVDGVRMDVAILEDSEGNLLELLEYSSHPGKRREPVLANDIGASHFALTIDDLDARYEERQEYDVRFISPPLLSPDGVKVAYAVVMDECIVELVQELNATEK